MTRTAWVDSGAGYDAFRPGELNAGLEAADLMYRAGFDFAQMGQMADQRRHAVIAQTAGMEPRRNEAGAERVHLDQRR